MYHVAAYTGNVSTTANTDIAALTDQVLTISNNHFRLVDNMSLVAAVAMSATLQRARLDSPTLRLLGNPYILPPRIGAAPGAEPRVLDLTRYPYALPTREELAMQATSGIAMGNETFTGLIFLSLGMTPVPPGRIQWIRITSTTAAVANTWTSIAATFETSLPSGYFSVVGVRHQSTNAQAIRLIFPGQVWRPGGVSVTGLGDRQAPIFIDGSLGELGRFVNDNPPQFQVLVNGTDNSHEIYLGLVQVGSM